MFVTGFGHTISKIKMKLLSNLLRKILDGKSLTLLQLISMVLKDYCQLNPSERGYKVKKSEEG